MFIPVGKAKEPPVPINKELKHGTCPYLFISPADLKLFPFDEISSILTIILLRSDYISGKLCIIASYTV
jgi:hypothetical protein